MADRIEDPLRAAALFELLHPATRACLIERAKADLFPADTWLFHAGDPGDAMYVITAGRVDVISETPPPARLVKVIGRGGVLGELALLSGGPRSASARARRDTAALRIDRADFEALLRDDPDLALAMVQVLADKLAESSSVRSIQPPPPKTIAVFGFEDDASWLASALAERWQSWGRVAVLGDEHVDEISELSATLDRCERDNSAVLLVGGPLAGGRWADFCLRQADRNVIVSQAHSRYSTELPDMCDLVIVGRTPAASHLTDRVVRAHHLLHSEHDTIGLDRLARRLAGRSIGVVLSGGGARGLAHIGVLDGLREGGVVIDRVGGCSMGALVGALFATGRDPSETQRWCQREIVDRRPFSDFTVPRVALIRARRAQDMLQRTFGDVNVEDTSLDYFAVSADLVSAEVVVHRRGPLWQAIGASMAVPGYAPPVVVEGRVLVDGGVLDNMPVEVMADTAEGPVIAVDVMGRGRIASTDRARPRLLDTLARATVIGSRRWTAQSRECASLVIEPAVGDIGLLDFQRLRDAVEAGRRAALAAIERSGSQLGLG